MRTCRYRMAAITPDQMTISRPCNLADPVQRQLLFQSIRALPPGRYEVRIEPRERATPAQRGYLHGVVVPMLAALLFETQGTEFGDEDAWEWAKLRFRPRETVDPLTGEVRVVGRSTRRMSKGELFAFTDELIQFLTECGVDVPPPDPNYQRQRQEAHAPR